ncbi:GMC family oxidoreductase [Pseudonocardia alaniniphila]|uniref:GMC family oxidoreductase n=1 Tax=Pseudonocardia alaniniphila TaxID=75291 RepID=UPI0024027031|nr:GMC family oxidoreductase N-terminal domain-containing protein [Pseudonocardia alaniniphila]
MIVGAGTAGCVLASRLTEDAGTRVLLVEAGSRDPLPAAADPQAWPSLAGTSMDWGDVSVSVPGSPRVRLPRGRGVGGSSAINAMSFIRGHRASYDAWVAAGATGWGFDDLLPFLKRSEHVEGRDPAVRGNGGPLRLWRVSPPHPLSETMLEAARQVGHPLVNDIDSGVQEGFGWAEFTIVDGRRQSAADAYLRPALQRPNLDVVTDALVHRLLFSGERCTGLKYKVGSEVVSVTCDRDVVLAAGAIGSPQLLMRSGVGPQSHLREVGVPIVADLPGVGANLHDHPLTGVVYRSRQPVVGSVGNGGGEAKGTIRTTADAAWPDVQLFCAIAPMLGDTVPGPERGAGYTIVVAILAPFSRGSVRLASADPAAAPLIDPAYFSDSRDLDAAVTGLRAARDLGNAPAFAPWRGEEAQPGLPARDDHQLRGYVRRSMHTYFHYAGTCRMGTDDHAVVDTELRVRGIEGLRVIDASVMPTPVNANTNATVYGIAERAAHLLRARAAARV